MENKEIIVAVLSEVQLKKALVCPIENVFLLNANLLKLALLVKAIKEKGKHLYVHFDLTECIGKDAIGLQYLKRIGATGIISTRSNLVKLAKEQNLKTIQHVFIMDTHSIDTALESIHVIQPDMVEIMPVLSQTQIKVITGGLIESAEDVQMVFEAGAKCISTTNYETDLHK